MPFPAFFMAAAFFLDAAAREILPAFFFSAVIFFKVALSTCSSTASLWEQRFWQLDQPTRAALGDKDQLRNTCAFLGMR